MKLHVLMEESQMKLHVLMEEQNCNETTCTHGGR